MHVHQQQLVPLHNVLRGTTQTLELPRVPPAAQEITVPRGLLAVLSVLLALRVLQQHPLLFSVQKGITLQLVQLPVVPVTLVNNVLMME